MGATNHMNKSWMVFNVIRHQTLISLERSEWVLSRTSKGTQIIGKTHMNIPNQIMKRVQRDLANTVSPECAWFTIL